MAKAQVWGGEDDAVRGGLWASASRTDSSPWLLPGGWPGPCCIGVLPPVRRAQHIRRSKRRGRAVGWAAQMLAESLLGAVSLIE